MLAIGMFRWRLFDLQPVANAAVIVGMADGLVIVDQRGWIVEANPTAQTILDPTGDGLVGKSMEQVIPLRVLLGDEAREIQGNRVEIKLASGGKNKDYEINYSSFQDKRGSPGGRIIFLHDVTEVKILEEKYKDIKIKHAEAMLQQSEDRYQTLYRSMSVGAIYLGADGKVADANPAAGRILGVKVNQISKLNTQIDALETIHADGREYPAQEHPSRNSLEPASH